ncbi:MAG: hypothetical protein Q8P08_02055 [bacterium]|nr:hypothetical protein [bacterium]
MSMKKIGGYLAYKVMELNKIKKKLNKNSILVARYKEKPVLFNPCLARISGSATSGLFICQLLYWHERGDDKNWVYKTMKELEEETCLTRSQQDRAIARWKELGVLTVEKRGLPQKRHFHVDLEKLEVLIKDAKS